MKGEGKEVQRSFKASISQLPQRLILETEVERTVYLLAKRGGAIFMGQHQCDFIFDTRRQEGSDYSPFLLADKKAQIFSNAAAESALFCSHFDGLHV